MVSDIELLGEPTNDMDTDMLAAMEDLLDTWPGPLLVVSHDRYLLERVTDTQYAVLEGRVRHLPGGIDQYLRLRSEGVGDAGDARSASGAPAADAASSAPTAGGAATAPSGKERREAQKEVSSLERRIEKLEGRITALHADMAAHDPSDYAGLQDLAAEVRSAEDESAGLEERWLELSTIIEHS